MVELAGAHTRHREFYEARPRPRSQGSSTLHLQRQQAREGFLRRRQASAIAAARREAQEAKAKAIALEEKIKTMEATLSRVAAMLPSLERLQRREDAATAKIQAALQGHKARKTVRNQRRAVQDKKERKRRLRLCLPTQVASISIIQARHLYNCNADTGKIIERGGV